MVLDTISVTEEAPGRSSSSPEGRPERSRRLKDAALLLGAVLILGGIHLATLRDGQEWGDDFSLYLSHARNIAEGRPYADTRYIYNPQNAVIAPRSYPPIFPLLLAPVYHAYGMDLAAMKAFVVVLFVGLLGVLAVLYRQRLPLPYSLGCLTLFALNPYVWQHKDRLLSEVPFMLFAYLTLLLAEKGRRAEGALTGRIAWGLLTGLTAYLAFGTRTVGIVLIPSILAGELLNRRRLGLTSLAVVAAFTIGAGVQKSLLVLEGSYLDQVVYDPLLFARNALALAGGSKDFLETGFNATVCTAVFGCFIALACCGYLARLRKGPTAWEVFLALNCMLLVFWPPTEHAAQRFLLPILPLFFLYVSEGLDWLSTTPLRRLEKATAAVSALAVLLSYAGSYARLDVGPVRDGVRSPAAVALFDWITGHTNLDDVVLFQKPKALALFTDRRVVAHHHLAGDESVRQFLRTMRVTHVVLCRSSVGPFQTSRELLGPFLERHDEAFEKVYEAPDFQVYRVRRAELASEETRPADRYR